MIQSCENCRQTACFFEVRINLGCVSGTRVRDKAAVSEVLVVEALLSLHYSRREGEEEGGVEDVLHQRNLVSLSLAKR